MLGREGDDFRLRKRFSSRKFLKPKSLMSPAESPAVAPGEKFSVPASLGAARSLLRNPEGLMQPGFVSWV